MNKTATASVIVFTSKGEKIETSQAEARLLLKAKQAKVIKTTPFTLVLLDREKEIEMVNVKKEKKDAAVVVNEALGAVASGGISTDPNTLPSNQSIEEMINGEDSQYVDKDTDLYITNLSRFEAFVCSDIMVGTGNSARELCFEPATATNITRVGLTKDDLVKSPEFVDLFRRKKIVEGKQPLPSDRPDLYKKNDKWDGDIDALASIINKGAAGTMTEINLDVDKDPYIQKLKEMEEEDIARNAKVGVKNPLENYTKKP